jgi:hypothetical protein
LADLLFDHDDEDGRSRFLGNVSVNKTRLTVSHNEDIIFKTGTENGKEKGKMQRKVGENEENAAK